MIQVPVVSRQMLEMPNDFAGVRIDRKRRVGIQMCAGAGSAGELGVRNRGCGPPEDQVQLGIIAAGAPERTALALLQRNAVPGGIARIARPRNGVRTPELSAGFRIVGSEKAAAAC